MEATIDPDALPSGTGCGDCEAEGGWWFHLRRCVTCGHIGCCDDSPNSHALAHYRAAGHPIIRSFEPGESWGWNYETGGFVRVPDLAPPQHRPVDQPAPGPAGRVPDDWKAQLRPHDG
jgi:hypothetical protein